MADNFLTANNKETTEVIFLRVKVDAQKVIILHVYKTSAADDIENMVKNRGSL